MKRSYFIVTTLNQDSGWRIVAGPFNSRAEAEADESFSKCSSPDIYAQTEYKNARVVSYTQLSQLTSGIPRKRLGRAGRDRLFENYEEEGL